MPFRYEHFSLNKEAEHTERQLLGMLEKALRPLARLMIKSGWGAGELVEVVKSSYISAAIDEVIPANGSINISRLAVATGFSRKEIAAMLRREDAQPALDFPKKGIEQRAVRVLRGWRTDPLFQRTNGRPLDLPLRGEENSFSVLVKKYGADVTPVSVLRELERMGAASIARSGKLKMHTQATGMRKHAAKQLAEFVSLLKDFTTAIQQTDQFQDRIPFFVFKETGLPAPVQVALFQRTFSKRALALIEGMDQWVKHQTPDEKTEEKDSAPKARVGLGIYLVQEDTESDPPARSRRKPKYSRAKTRKD